MQYQFFYIQHHELIGDKHSYRNQLLLESIRSLSVQDYLNKRIWIKSININLDLPIRSSCWTLSLNVGNNGWSGIRLRPISFKKNKIKIFILINYFCIYFIIIKRYDWLSSWWSILSNIIISIISCWSWCTLMTYWIFIARIWWCTFADCTLFSNTSTWKRRIRYRFLWKKKNLKKLYAWINILIDNLYELIWILIHYLPRNIRNLYIKLI